MLGRTPPEAMVTVPSSLESSSSLRMASWMWRGTMRVFLLSREALPGSYIYKVLKQVHPDTGISKKGPCRS